MQEITIKVFDLADGEKPQPNEQNLHVHDDYNPGQWDQGDWEHLTRYFSTGKYIMAPDRYHKWARLPKLSQDDIEERDDMGFDDSLYPADHLFGGTG